ncbi:MAG TPA: FAD-dependent oxidoreductase [Vicinamibacterales bacterium]|nr:FAD-dependent oxidoreductase [Vicinamibacterales bacterium]
MSVKPPRHPAYDVIVVGARCAGAATALLLARAGARVLAVDRSEYGTDTLSTHALMRGGVLQLQRWGILARVKAAKTPPVLRTSFHYGDEALEIPIKSRDGVDALYSPRRTVLDRLLVDAAIEAGAEVAFHTRVAGLLRRDDGRVTGIVTGAGPAGSRITASMVVGADGLHSGVAQLVDAGIYRRGRHASSVIYGYWADLAQDGNHWHFRPGTSIGVIPTNDGLTCVFASMPPRRFLDAVRPDISAGYLRILAECSPSLAAELGDARLTGTLHGFPGVTGFFRQSWGPGWALVGDAAYFKDPLTAHGITDALRDAEFLARAIGRGTNGALADYQRVRDELVDGHFEVTDAIASFEWDLASVRGLHHHLSDEMNKEVRAILALDAQADGAPPSSPGPTPVALAS